MKKFLATLAFVLLSSLPAVAAQNTLVVYNWSEYIPQSVLARFTKETGIKVVYSTFESNEAMHAKIKLQRGKGYDLIVPTNNTIGNMRAEKLLAPIDKSKLSNLKHLDPKLMGQAFDPANEYSIPYMWGSVGLVVNKKYIDPATITSWRDLLRPEFKGKVLLSDDLRDSMGVGLKATGHSVNSTDEKALQDAAAFLKELRPSVKVFDVTVSKQSFVKEKVHIGMMWNGDSLVAKKENPNLAFIYPEEGAILWVDSFAIPKGARNREGAHLFINFLLRPEVARECVTEYRYSTPNLGTLKLLPEELRDNRVLVPAAQDLKNGEFLNSVANALPLYERYWERVKPGK